MKTIGPHASQPSNPASDPQPVQDGEPGARSGYGTVPGEEMPSSVYISVFLAFAWIVVASWIAFAHGADADLALGFATVLTVVFFALPLLVYMTAKSRSAGKHNERGEFLSSPVETATGCLTGASAWVQVLLVPAALALAATLIGTSFIFAH